jgi:hypothetical protein
MTGRSRASRLAGMAPARVPSPGPGVPRRRLAVALPALAAGLVLVGALLAPMTAEEPHRATTATSTMADAGGPPFPPIRSRAIVSTGLGIRTLDIVVAIAWRGRVPDDQAVTLVLRPVPRSIEPPSSVVVRAVTIPVALLDRAGAQLSLRAVIDVSALRRGDYGVYVQLPPQTGGAWASSTRAVDERMIRIYSAPHPPPVAVCCPEW